MSEVGAESCPDIGLPSQDISSELETMFKHRYTDEDQEYKKTLETPLADPPCVENWYQRPKRSWSRDGPSRGGYDQRDNRYGRKRHWEERDKEGWSRVEHRSWGQGQRSDGFSRGSNRVHYLGRRAEDAYGKSQRN